MRKLLVATFVLIALPSMVGCQCCRALWECEQAKNQWLLDHLCNHSHCHQRTDPAVAPLVAVPVATAVAPAIMAPPAQPVPYVAAPAAVCPPVAVCPPQQICQPQPVCQPVTVCPQVCPQMQNCCEGPVIYDPPSNCCEPMCCP
ncbi:MAG TPA: hypothetical protein VMF30_04225 [Pirellulales bacterium]|nr:hypothetical protein [Pirellulales bacterium]